MSFHDRDIAAADAVVLNLGASSNATNGTPVANRAGGDATPVGGGAAGSDDDERLPPAKATTLSTISTTTSQTMPGATATRFGIDSKKRSISHGSVGVAEQEKRPRIDAERSTRSDGNANDNDNDAGDNANNDGDEYGDDDNDDDGAGDDDDDGDEEAEGGEKANENPYEVDDSNDVRVFTEGCRSVDCYQRLNEIEEGSYGVVYRAKDTETGEIFALKKIKLEKESEVRCVVLCWRARCSELRQIRRDFR
jgi:hypothetical protein